MTTKWDYKVITLPVATLRESMRRFGDEGWELVAAVAAIEEKHTLYFKKKIEDAAAPAKTV